MPTGWRSEYLEHCQSAVRPRRTGGRARLRLAGVPRGDLEGRAEDLGTHEFRHGEEELRRESGGGGGRWGF